PVRIAWIVPHDPLEEQIGGRREAHRRPRMARSRLLHRVHREHADQVHRPGVGVRPLKLGIHRLAAQSSHQAFLSLPNPTPTAAPSPPPSPRPITACPRPSSDLIAVPGPGYLRTTWLKCLVTHFAELIRQAFAGS